MSRALGIVIAAVAVAGSAAPAEAATLLQQTRRVDAVRTLTTVAYECLDEFLIPGCPSVVDESVLGDSDTAPDFGPFDATAVAEDAVAEQLSSLGEPIAIVAAVSVFSNLTEVCVFGQPGCETAVQVVEVDTEEAESRLELGFSVDEPSEVRLQGSWRAYGAAVPAYNVGSVAIEVARGGEPVWSLVVDEPSGDSGVVPLDVTVPLPVGPWQLRVSARAEATASQLPLGPIPAVAEAEVDLTATLAPAAPVPVLPGGWHAGAPLAVLALTAATLRRRTAPRRARPAPISG